MKNSKYKYNVNDIKWESIKKFNKMKTLSEQRKNKIHLYAIYRRYNLYSDKETESNKMKKYVSYKQKL